MKNLAGITRRRFLRGAIAGGSAIGLSRRAKAQGGQKTRGNRQGVGGATTRRELLNWWLKQNPLLRTAIETPFVSIGAGIAGKIRRHPELKNQLEEEVRRGNLGVSEIMFLGPVLEEIAFRLLPSVIIDGALHKARGKSIWAVGIPVSAIFAMAHYNHYYPKELRKRFVPLNEFVLGTYYWHLMRKRGFSSAVLGHSESNLVAFLGHSESNLIAYFIAKSKARKEKK